MSGARCAERASEAGARGRTNKTKRAFDNSEDSFRSLAAGLSELEEVDPPRVGRARRALWKELRWTKPRGGTMEIESRSQLGDS